MLTVAIPATKLEDGITEQDGLGSLLGSEPITEPVEAPPVYRRNLVLDSNVRDEDGNPKFIIVSVSDTSQLFKNFVSLKVFKEPVYPTPLSDESRIREG